VREEMIKVLGQIVGLDKKKRNWQSYDSNIENKIRKVFYLVYYILL